MGIKTVYEDFLNQKERLETIFSKIETIFSKIKNGEHVYVTDEFSFDNTVGTGVFMLSNIHKVRPIDRRGDIEIIADSIFLTRTGDIKYREYDGIAVNENFHILSPDDKRCVDFHSALVMAEMK